MGQGHPVDGGADAGACGHGLGDGADLDGDAPRCNLRQMAGREQPKQGAAEPVCVWPLELSMASGVTTVTDLSTSTDSPVRADSSTHKSFVSIRRRASLGQHRADRCRQLRQCSQGLRGAESVR